MRHVDLTDCEKEPIHIPGKIQGHGFLLIVDPQTLIILQASTNTDTLAGVPAGVLCGRSIRDFIAAPDLHYILTVLGSGEYAALNPLRVAFAAAEAPVLLDCIVNRSEEVILLEFEPTDIDDPAYVEPFMDFIQASSAMFAKAGTVHELCSIACRQVRAYTGYDRVMLYRFDAEWNGEVLAEARTEYLEPLEGHHYPASDIPRQARELFLKNRIRIIPDVNYTPSDLVPLHNPLTQRPTDLTYSILRNVSPIHIQYLKNMHVAASLTISIIINGSLWGMIACHHTTPKYTGYNTRKECDIIGRLFSHHLTMTEQRSTEHYTTRLASLEQDVYHDMLRDFSITAGIERNDNRLLELTGAAGMSVNYRGKLHRMGTTPSEEDIDNLYLWLSIQSFTDVLAVDNLPQRLSSAEQYRDTASGILAMPISRASDEYLVWYRPERARTIRWAGNPDKAAYVDPGTQKISPRQSFEVWKQVVRGTSLPWLKAEIDTALQLQIHIQELILKGYRRLTSLTDKEKQEQYLFEMRVSERTLGLQKDMHRLRLELEKSRMRELHVSSSLVITGELIALLKNRLANMSLGMMRQFGPEKPAVAPTPDRDHATPKSADRIQEYIRKLSELSVTAPVVLSIS